MDKNLCQLVHPYGWRLKARGEGDDRGWDGWMASPTSWTWVWVSSGSWWWTGRPGMLQSMGLDATEWELNWCICMLYSWWIYPPWFRGKKKNTELHFVDLWANWNSCPGFSPWEVLPISEEALSQAHPSPPSSGLDAWGWHPMEPLGVSGFPLMSRSWWITQDLTRYLSARECLLRGANCGLRLVWGASPLVTVPLPWLDLQPQGGGHLKVASAVVQVARLEAKHRFSWRTESDSPVSALYVL